jgi:hypothetical protein
MFLSRPCTRSLTERATWAMAERVMASPDDGGCDNDDRGQNL